MKDVWPEIEAKRWPWRKVGRYRFLRVRRGAERFWVVEWAPK